MAAGLKDKIAAAAGSVTVAKPKTLKDQIEALVPQLARAAGNNISADKMARLALTEIRKNKNLALSTPESFMGALMTCAQMGLEPGPHGHAYLLPFKNKGVYETQLIIGYRGMMDMVRRSREIVGVPKARLVYENDLFDLKFTDDGDKFEHTPYYLRKDGVFPEPGKLLMGYLYVQYQCGGSDIFPMSLAEINKHRKRSKAADSGPWVTDFEAMAKKTLVRANFAYLPMSIDDQAVVAERDGSVARIDIAKLEAGGAIEVEFSDANEDPSPEPEEAVVVESDETSEGDVYDPTTGEVLGAEAEPFADPT